MFLPVIFYVHSTSPQNNWARSQLIVFMPPFFFYYRQDNYSIVFPRATTFLSFTHSFALAHLFRFMTGIGSAFCFLSSVRLASRWFHPKRLALVVGLIVTMAMTGGMIAQAPLSLLNHYLGWRQTVFCVAALGAIILILIYFLVQDYPPHAKHEHKAQCDELREMGYWHSMLRSYLNWQNWMGGIYTSLLNLPIVILGSLWGS